MVRNKLKPESINWLFYFVQIVDIFPCNFCNGSYDFFSIFSVRKFGNCLQMEEKQMAWHRLSFQSSSQTFIASSLCPLHETHVRLYSLELVRSSHSCSLRAFTFSILPVAVEVWSVLVSPWPSPSFLSLSLLRSPSLLVQIAFSQTRRNRAKWNLSERK